MTNPSSASDLYIGLMSGTSADGIDVALVALDSAQKMPALVLGRTYAWSDALRDKIMHYSQAATTTSLDETAEFDVQLGIAFADAVHALLREADIQPGQIKAIGSHGQTLRHNPTHSTPYTMQLGDPNTLVERTGITTVADFRRRDVAAGGHGAPLLPALHAALFQSSSEARAVLNLGGIANLTLLPTHADVRGFDTGPANALMDAWCHQHTGNAFDENAQLARRGRVVPDLLEHLLRDPWLQQPPPKSTGRDRFHLQWLQHSLQGGESVADVQATLLAFTATTIVQALLRTQPETARILACGGGVHNPLLMQAIQLQLPDVVLESTLQQGVDPDFIEAMGFAWFAHQTLQRKPANLPSVTGAQGLRVLGGIYFAL